jgi:5-methylcytosine-specific restriction enzyme B
MLAKVSDLKFQEALSRFDDEWRVSPEFESWDNTPSYTFALEAKGQRYPLKKIVSLAAGVDTSDFRSSQAINEYLTTRGFSIIELEVNAIRQAFETILRNYASARALERFSSRAPISKTFNKCRQLLSTRDLLETFPTIRVKSSYGQGNWAKIPWIAFLDSRQAASTREGVYPAILFREDCSGLYVTLNQGVSKALTRLGVAGATAALLDQARQIQQQPCVAFLESQGFLMDDGIDLKSTGRPGLDYESSTIAYKFYGRSQIPEDEVILEHVASLLEAYSDLAKTSPIVPAAFTSKKMSGSI